MFVLRQEVRRENIRDEVGVATLPRALVIHVSLLVVVKVRQLQRQQLPALCVPVSKHELEIQNLLPFPWW